MVRGSLALALALLDIPRRPAKLWPVVGYAAAYEGAADILRRCHQAKISRATITTSTTCNNRPKIEAKPAIPPKNPCPNSRPNRPAPRNPAANPPNKPRPKKPGLGVAWPEGAAPERCVNERSIGVAVGAVE